MPNKITAEELKNIWQAQNLEQSQIEVLAELEAIKAENEAIKQELEDVNVKLSETLAVQLMGSNLEYYGATIADRPDANSVQVGTWWMAVDSGTIYQSNGTDWVVRS